jgi:hypothetical protein
MPEAWKAVSFTKESWKRFVNRYNTAVEKKEEEFVFEGECYLTDFTKYFIEYHGPKFAGKDR